MNGAGALTTGTNSKIPEILAPGGSIEAIETAMANGADAVYLGVGDLNARARAANLQEPQLPGIVEYVHSFGSRVYVTLNIPVTRFNVRETARTMAACHESGVDALIVRDPVIMKTAAALLPDLPIHASTQAGVHSVETARRMADLGCRRVILARECSRNDISAIRKALPDLELEVFVFGAMCFGVSGLCMMGHSVSGRSGNHGACCQSCRLPYFDTGDEPVGYVFSMKDLDLVPHIPELVALGVAAFKIEGRLKTPSWVGCVTKWLRTALDRPVPGLDSAEYAQFDRDVSVLFSRRRTDGFFVGDTDAETVLSTDNQTHAGLDVGQFRSRQDHTGHWISFKTPVDINVRDGLLVKVGDDSAPGGCQWLPVGVRALVDGRGRSAIRIAAGHDVSVPLPEELRRSTVLAVHIHSADSVRARYRKVERPVPGAVVEGTVPWPEFLAAEVRADSITASMRLGRFKAAASCPIESSAARAEGISADHLKKYFGMARTTITPGLFVNPSSLKAARRELIAGFMAARDEEIRQRAEALATRISSMSDQFQPSDDELIDRGNGTVAISRVTGMKEGCVYTSGGDGFRIEPGADSTRIRKA